MIGFEGIPEMMKQLPKGAFLTVGEGEEANPMTIGWALSGIIWGKPVMMVAVRYSRHTYGLMDKAETFTVSVPEFGDLKKELSFCGSKSGCDFQKFAETGLTAQPAKSVSGMVVKEAAHHYECKVLYRQSMEPANLDEEIKKRFYEANQDYHVFFIGEIVNEYEG
jgi:flavin reductase (DIM6/NTAB) family NADH-FMN oxidoreductase RutF